jgi:hypothetical protein
MKGSPVRVRASALILFAGIFVTFDNAEKAREGDRGTKRVHSLTGSLVSEVVPSRARIALFAGASRLTAASRQCPGVPARGRTCPGYPSRLVGLTQGLSDGTRTRDLRRDRPRRGSRRLATMDAESFYSFGFRGSPPPALASLSQADLAFDARLRPGTASAYMRSAIISLIRKLCAVRSSRTCAAALDDGCLLRQRRQLQRVVRRAQSPHNCSPASSKPRKANGDKTTAPCSALVGAEDVEDACALRSATARANTATTPVMNSRFISVALLAPSQCDEVLALDVKCLAGVVGFGSEVKKLVADGRPAAS